MREGRGYTRHAFSSMETGCTQYTSPVSDIIQPQSTVSRGDCNDAKKLNKPQISAAGVVRNPYLHLHGSVQAHL